MISIKGISLVELHIARDSNGVEQVSGTYHLMSNNDKVLAKQSFNGYNEIKLAPTGDTATALHQAMACVKADLEKQLGLTEV